MRVRGVELGEEWRICLPWMTLHQLRELGREKADGWFGEYVCA